MIPITKTLFLLENELHFDFVRSGGPGGQNVNKVSTAVQLTFDVANSPSLPERVRERLLRLARNKIRSDGVLVIKSQRTRSQDQNRADAVNRLVELIRQAAVVPKTRHKTKPTKASKRRRLEKKRRRSDLKKLRRPPTDF